MAVQSGPIHRADVADVTQPSEHARERIPRDATNDYTAEQAERLRVFVEEHSGAGLDHVGRFSCDPATLPVNIENFLGVAQVPIRRCRPAATSAQREGWVFVVQQDEVRLYSATTSGRRRARIGVHRLAIGRQACGESGRYRRIRCPTVSKSR